MTAVAELVCSLYDHCLRVTSLPDSTSDAIAAEAPAEVDADADADADCDDDACTDSLPADAAAAASAAGADAPACSHDHDGEQRTFCLLQCIKQLRAALALTADEYMESLRGVAVKRVKQDGGVSCVRALRSAPRVQQ